MTRYGLETNVLVNEIKYALGKGLPGFFRTMRLRRQLRDAYFHVSSDGHVTPFLIPRGYPSIDQHN